MNVYDPVYYWAKTAPVRPACAFPGGFVTYEQLCNASDAAAIAIQRAGFRTRDLVNIAVVNPVFQLILLIALGRLGMSAAMLPPNNLSAAGAMSFAGLITDNPNVAKPEGRHILADHKWFISKLSQENPPRPEPAQFAAADVVRLVTTSGATGISKGVALTHGMVEERLRSSPVLPENRRALSMIPPSGSWGFLIALKLLRSGGTFCFAPFPDQCLDVCDSLGVEYICASVAQAASLVEEQKKAPRDLARLNNILVGGSLVAPGLIDNLRRYICRNVIITYGASEGGQVASAPQSLIAQTPGAVGYLHPGSRVEIVDEQDRRLPADKSGVVRIRGGGAATNYLNDSTGADGVFRDGWFYPGDTGTLTRDSLLIIDGRTSELVLNKGGLKISPAVIEDMMMREAEITEAGVVAGESSSGAPELWAAIVMPGTFNADRLQKTFEDKLGGFAPDRIFRVDALPRNEIGKIQYKDLRAILQPLATPQS